MDPQTEWLIDAATWTLRNSLHSSVLIALVAVMLVVFGGRIAPKFRAVLWILVGIRLVLPIAPESGVSVFNLGAVMQEPPAVASDSVPTEAESAVFPVFSADSLVRQSGRLSSGGILAGIWLLGVLAIFGIAIFRQVATLRWVRGLPEPEEPALSEWLRVCAKRAGTRRIPRLVESARVSEIAVFGGLRASHIIIPADFSQRFSEAEIRGIFLHELAHIRRGDLLWNWAALAIQALHWFNPLVWWAGRRFLADRELVCDRFAMDRLPAGERGNYGQALLKALEIGVRPRVAAPALVPFLSQKSELKHRLTMIKKSHPISPIVQVLAAVLAIAACAMTFTSALADDERREGDRAAEAERPGPRDGEGEGRRSPEAERPGPRDGEGEGRRSPEAERRGPRDGEGDGRRSPEAERRGPRDGEGDGARLMDRPGELKVTVVSDGVVIGDKKIALINLRRELDASRATSAVVMAQPNTPFQNLATVMNALRSSGIRDVRVATGDEDSPAMRRDGEGDGGARVGPRDGEGDGGARVGPRDGEGDGGARVGPRDGEGDGGARVGPRDGEGDGGARVGPRDGEGDGGARVGPRDGEGAPRVGPRDGEGEAAGRREGDGDARGAARAMDDRTINQLSRIYRAYDKNGDNRVTFEEWVAMKNYELTREQREREKGWFDQADANNDEKMTLGEWIDWKASQGR